MHDLETKISTIKNIRPSIYDSSWTSDHRLIEAEAIKIERHSRYAERREPNAYDWPHR